MIDTITRREVEDLSRRTGVCVSLCIPTSPKGRDRMEGKIRLRNLIEKAHNLLVEGGMRSTLAWELLQPASDLLNDPDFWMELSKGLAVYISRGFTRVLHLAETTAEVAVVGTHFHIRPIVSAVSSQGAFVLTLDEKEATLYFVRGDHIRELDVPGMPRSMAEALGPEHSEKQRQSHSV